MKKYVYCLILIVGLTFLSSCSCDTLNQISKNLTNYKMNINVDCENKTINATEIVSYYNESDESLMEIRFHLYPNAYKRENSTQKPVSEYNFEKAYENGFDSGYIDIKRVCGENVKSFQIIGEEQNILVAELLNKIDPKSRCDIEIEFFVKIPNVLQRFGYGERTINVGNFYPIICVYENGEFVQDVYHYNGDPFYSDMANYDVCITYDSSYTIGCTGEMSTTQQLNTKQTKSKAKVVRDFAFILSNKFKTISTETNETQVNYLYYNDDNAEQSLQVAVDAVNTFEKMIGDYVYTSLTIAQSNFLHGGMEYPNLVFVSDTIEKQTDYFNVIVHEIGHQWFYNLIGNNEYSEAWLDEGLTEYATVLFFEANPTYKIEYNATIGSMLSSYQLFVDVYSNIFGELDTSMTRKLNEYTSEPEYTYCVYVKGVLMLDYLRDYIGESSFYMGLKNYYNDNVYKIAKQENFISAFEKASNKNIDKVLEPWLNGSVVLQNFSSQLSQEKIIEKKNIIPSSSTY